MNKVLVSICIAGTALAMSSCRSVEKAMPLSSINGEWNIIEVNGSKVTPGESRTLPFITFDTATGRVSGNRDRKSTRLNSSHTRPSRMPSSA